MSSLYWPYLIADYYRGLEVVTGGEDVRVHALGHRRAGVGDVGGTAAQPPGTGSRGGRGGCPEDLSAADRWRVDHGRARRAGGR